MDERKISTEQKLDAVYLCLHCGAVRHVTINKSISVTYKLQYTEPVYKVDPILVSTDEELKCNICEEYPMIQVDRDLIYHIKKLNEKGYFTRCSCSGHSNDMNAYIGFLPGIAIPTLPEGWYIDEDSETYALYVSLINGRALKHNVVKSIIIRSRDKFDGAKLKDWVDSLSAINKDTNVDRYTPFPYMEKAFDLYKDESGRLQRV